MPATTIIVLRFHGLKMMQLQYICAKLGHCSELNQAAQRFSANISTNVPLHTCHACIYKHIHIHINSTMYINRSRYTYIIYFSTYVSSLQNSQRSLHPKCSICLLPRVEIHRLGPTSFKASNSERNKAWPWPNFSSERTEGEAAKPKSFFLQRWTDSASQFLERQS